jgi:dihydropteroate synthase type 2
MARMTRTFGIVNVTRDSFSDGGRFLAAPDAIARARQLLADGADVIDVGAESTHPDAEVVPAEVERDRLLPVVQALVAAGAEVSIDTRKPAVAAALAAAGARWWNDVDGLRSDAALAVARALPGHVKFVAMFSRSRDGRAVRGVDETAGLLAAIRVFFAERIAAFAAAGIARERLVLDPGMGFFLGDTHAHSLVVLRHLAALRREFGPLLVSVSRKSFVGALTGAPAPARGPGTLAAELWAARAGVEWIRTHDVRALRDALTVEHAIEEQA